MKITLVYIDDNNDLRHCQYANSPEGVKAAREWIRNHSHKSLIVYPTGMVEDYT